MSLRPCSSPGCPALVKRGRCPRHEQANEAWRQQRRDAAPGRALYATAEWRRIRAAQLAAFPLCAVPGCGRPATDVDHIAPHRGDEALFFAGPFQSLCHQHHSAKTMREANARMGRGRAQGHDAGGGR